MPASSAGILMYRRTGETMEVLLVRPGRPFWRNNDRGAWLIPEGEIEQARIRRTWRNANSGKSSAAPPESR
jgi:predicted NUDIX family NTP pyrophosphohydrolase